MDSVMIQTLTRKLSDVTTLHRWACSCREKSARSNMKEASNCPDFSNKQDEETIMHGSVTNLNERKSYYFSGMELVLDQERPLRGCTVKNNQSETRRLVTKEDFEWWNNDEEDSVEICKRQRSSRKAPRRTIATPTVDSEWWDMIDDEEDSIKYYKRRLVRKTRTVNTTDSFCCAE